jgi:Transposase DDE domain group 1
MILDLVHGRRPPRGIVLDMDSSVSPTHGEQEMSVWNGHYACTCYHPLFVFNQFGDLERSELRPGNVHSANGWDGVLKPAVARYQGKVSRIYFRADAAFANPDVYEYLEAERIKYAIRTGRPGQDQLSAQTPGRATAERGASVLCQFHLSSGKLDQATPGDRQGRVAPRRACSARRLHRDEHEPPGRAGRRLLQQARHVRTRIKEGKGAIKWTRLSCRTFAANAVRLQPTISATSCATLATPEPIKDWSLTSLKEKLIKIGARVVSHGRYVAFQMAEVAIPWRMFQEILRLIAELRPRPPPAPA